MSEQQNWRTGVTAGDYLLHQKKQGQIDNRRPVIRKASDLVGPGIAATAVRISDFNDTLATFDGFFSADTDAINGPGGGDEAFVGTVVSDAELGGRQTFAGLTSGDAYQRVFTRNPMDATAIYWGSWELLGSGTGGGGSFLETLPVTIIDAKGDLIVGTGPDAATRLPVGADGTSPVADSTAVGGVAWANRLENVIEGDYVSIDYTDPLNPIINAYGMSKKWLWSDRFTAGVAGVQSLRLSRTPIDQSLVLRWHPDGKGPITQINENYTLSGRDLTFLDPHGDIIVGDKFSAQYEYDPNEAAVDIALGNLTTSLTGTIALPSSTVSGDLLILAVAGDGSLAVSDSRVVTSNVRVDPFFPLVSKGGVWTLRADGSGLPIAITGNITAILLRVSGDSTVTEKQFSENPTGNPWPIPATLPSVPSAGLAIAAVVCQSVGLVAGRLDTQVNWTYLGHVYDGNKTSCAMYYRPDGTFPTLDPISTGSDNRGCAMVLAVDTFLP